jgi:GT2 family glycosyltransferase
MKALIVIATIGREKELTLVMKSLEQQTYKDYEVYISSMPGITNVMNTALNAFDSDVIIRIDDDMVLQPLWLEEIMRVFKEYPLAGGVTGPTIVPKALRPNRDVFNWENLPNPLKWVYVNYFQEGNPYALAKMNRSGAFSLGSNYGAYGNDIFECDTLESCNYAVRTKLVRQLGGWDKRFAGVSEYFEQDMAWKIRKIGYKTYYNPQAYIYHMVSTKGNFNARCNYIDRLENWVRFYMRHLYRPSNTIRFLSYLEFQCLYYIYKIITKYVRIAH